MHGLFDSQEEEWNEVLRILLNLKTCSLINYIYSYCWRDTYRNFSLVKTLLVEALSCNAPEAIIKLPIGPKSSLETLNPATPPHCLDVMKNIIEVIKSYTMKMELYQKKVLSNFSRQSLQILTKKKSMK